MGALVVIGDADSQAVEFWGMGSPGFWFWDFQDALEAAIFVVVIDGRFGDWDLAIESDDF